MNRWKIHHDWSKELSLVLPQPQLQSSSQVKVLKKGNETHGMMREVSWDVLYVTEVLFWCWQCRCCESLCSPSTSAPCNTHPATSPHPTKRVLYSEKAIPHHLIYYVRCLYTTTSDRKLFRHLKCHHDLRNPVFRVTHSCLRCHWAAQWPCATAFSLRYKSLELLCHAPSQLDKNHQLFNQLVSGQSAVPLGEPIGRSPDELCEDRLQGWSLRLYLE